VQTSLLQAQIFMLDFQAARWLMEKDVAKQAGNDHPTSIPTGVFKTSDGYINIATTGGRIWQRFCEALGAPDLVNRPEYATGPDRSKNRKAINTEINKFTEKKSSETWVKEFNAAGVPCGPIYSIDQVFADAQVEHLGIAQDVPNDEGRHIRLVGQPFTLSRTPSKMAAQPPEFRPKRCWRSSDSPGRDRQALAEQNRVRARLSSCARMQHIARPEVANRATVLLGGAGKGCAGKKDCTGSGATSSRQPATVAPERAPGSISHWRRKDTC
jgi:crotonobetainyl-CoA:carnitine CoA-transferase CaiB-like acyl-CoA transferase